MGGFGEFFQQWLQQNGQGMGSPADQGQSNDYLNKYNQMNSQSQLQSDQNRFTRAHSNEMADREFAMGTGMSANHDQFQAPMQMGEMAAMARAFTPQRPFREDMPIGFGARYIQQLLGG